MAEAIKGFYSPRNPTTKDFYRLVEDHAENLEAIYPEKYERVFGFLRPVVKTTMDRYLECGTPKKQIPIKIIPRSWRSNKPSRGKES